MWKFKTRLAFSALAVFAAAAPAFSQWTIPTVPVYMPPTQWQISEGEQDEDEPVSRSKNVQIANVSFTYVPSPTRSKQTLANIVTRARAKNPASAERFQKFFSSVDVIGIATRNMALRGLSSANVADAVAVTWISAWQAAHGDRSRLSAQTYKAVSRQAARRLSLSPAFKLANDAQRQEMAEGLLIQSGLLDASLEQSHSYDQLDIVKKLAKQSALNTGLNMDEVKLTPNGFVSKR